MVGIFYCWNYGERKKEEEFWNIYILNKFSSIPWKVKNRHLSRFDRIL